MRMKALQGTLCLLLFLAPSWLAFGCDSCSSSGGGGGGHLDGATGDGGVDAGPCQTVLCGSPAVCCPEDTECIDSQCLPLCDSGIRCGVDLQTCCDQDQVCLSHQCVDPGDYCNDSYDCQQPGEFCEPTLGRCLPQPDPLTCEIVPTFDELEVVVEWSFEDDQIISIPVVGDINGDGVPEVAVNLTQQDGLSWPGGNIVVLNGQNGAELLRIPHNPGASQWGSHGRSSIGLGDVDGDLLPDIVYATREVSNGQSYIVAVDHTGALLWTSHDENGNPYLITVNNGAATLANFDADDEAEIVFGATLIDNDGLVVWDQGGGGGGGAFGSNAGYTGGISAVADMDGDGEPEIVSGRHAWKVDWQPGPSVNVVNYWTYSGVDGYPAITDLDGDGIPEVVLVGSRQIITLNGQTGQLWCGVDPTDAACQADPSLRTQPLTIPGGTSNNRGGPPTVADFDADGRPEIGVAGGYAYSVYDVNRPNEQIVQPVGDPPPADGALFVKWSHATQDLSSNATGSSVFDFQGDGAAEVVYADECFMRVYSGVDGTIQLEIPSSSATIHEYPLVVDVDGDGNSEILIVANEMGCTGQTPRWGLYVYGDANDEWVPTRKVWTQHTYHVTNATSNGNVPVSESDNWTTPGLNNYRQNVQGEGVFNAPDLTVDLSVGLDRCAAGELVLIARVSNIGALGVAPGVDVTFYEGTDENGVLLGSTATTVSLLPGASTNVTLNVPFAGEPADFFVLVNGAGSAVIIDECDGTNNTDVTTEAACDVIR